MKAFLANTWAVTALLAIIIVCMTVLVMTNAITWAEGRAAVTSLIIGAITVWNRGVLSGSTTKADGNPTDPEPKP